MPTQVPPTATPIPLLVIDPGPLMAGQPFVLGLALLEDITRPFDFYLLAEPPAGIYTIYFNGSIKKGITPLYKNVPRYYGGFSATIRPAVVTPPSLKGMTISFYVVMVEAGRIPKISRLEDISPQIPFIIACNARRSTVE